MRPHVGTEEGRAAWLRMDAWPKGSPAAPPSRGTAVRRRGGSFEPMEADERSAPGSGEREEDGVVAEAGRPPPPDTLHAIHNGRRKFESN